ncbi:hypothetical protein MHL31_14435 [Lutibacter sp. A80]|uniref:hypothetical protein n=1 Tax=Lutibacter sp. A80 TaxID=2918453 RepID=UPI001F063EBD|nr:hypothetical protein [Lutibacter sp. A80]UMB60268.1 hypothetical protein MHL31_14435 [Lutibacter sp. A80]
MIKKIIVIITLFVSVASFAQKNNASAYSFFGIGDKNNSNTVEQNSMGGIGVSLQDQFRLNLSNPASLSSLKFTTYTLAIENKNIWAEDSQDKQRGASTYLSYLAMGVPLGTHAGLSFGLLPNTSVGYSLVANSYDSSDELTEVSLYNGEGGTNKVFLGFGLQVFKGFSVGLQGNYIFGKVENNITNQLKDVALATKYETFSRINGFAINTGFQYKAKISEKINLHLGANFELESDVDSDDEEYIYSLSVASGEIPRDTLLSSTGTSVLKAPLKTSLGIGFGKENIWYAGIDYSFQDAIELSGNVYSNYSKVAYDDYSKISIGGFYTPKFTSITSYWERVTYRAGVKFEKSGLMVNSSGVGNDFTAIDDFGISFGVGLPVSNQLSNLNVGFEFGKRGEINKGLVQENYINFRLSFSLNDKWFKKREIF